MIATRLRRYITSFNNSWRKLRSTCRIFALGSGESRNVGFAEIATLVQIGVGVLLGFITLSPRHGRELFATNIINITLLHRFLPTTFLSPLHFLTLLHSLASICHPTTHHAFLTTRRRPRRRQARVHRRLENSWHSSQHIRT